MYRQAKGYPDIATRAFVRLISQHRRPPTSPPLTCPPPAILALTDCDPDGLSIASTYRYGSAALAHENAHLSIPSLQRLGVRLSDLVESNMSSDPRGLMKLTARDRKKALGMLRSLIFAEDGPEVEWRAEVQRMLVLGLKAEIEILSGRAGGLEGWLEVKLAKALTCEDGKEAS